MALPNDKRALQDRLSRVATRMAQKFGAVGWTGGGGTGGIPVSVLQNRIAGKKVILDNTGNEDPSALSFSLVDLGSGITATTGEQLIATTYIQDNFPTGVYGSPNALAMLAKLKAGVDSVDFHLIGDSNIGIGSSTATATNGRSDGFLLSGWDEGIARGLIRGCCAAMYATAVFPVMIRGSGSIIVNSQNFYKVSNGFHQDGSPNDHADGVTLQSGTLYAPSDFKQFFGTLSNTTAFRFSAAGNTADFAWLPGGRYTRQEKLALLRWDNQSLDAAGHIDTRNALTYRVVHGVQPGSTGSIALMMVGVSAGGGSNYNAGIAGYSFNNGIGNLPAATSYTNAGYRIGVSAGITGTTASYVTWASDSSRIGVTMEFLWSGYGGGLGGVTYVQGPIAVYLESVHGNTKGWAITQINYHGGVTTGGLASTITAASSSLGQNSALKTIIRETRERQIQAGGSGNLVVFVSSGVNDATLNGTTESTAASVYQTHLNTIISTYKTIWNDLGYPENDLAFIVATTHPVFLNPLPSGVSGGVNDWNMDDIRVQGKNYSQTQPDYASLSPYSNTLFVDITKLGPSGITQGGLTSGNSFNGNNSFYLLDGASGSHLTAGYSGGYAYLAELLVKRCLRYSASY